MLALAPLYVLWTFWTIAAVTASPIFTQNATHTSVLEQRVPSIVLYLGKQHVGTFYERWGLFFQVKGPGFAAKVLHTKGTAAYEPEMLVMKPATHKGWTLIDLNVEAQFAFQSGRDEFSKWIEHDMISKLRQPTARPGWWPQETPFDSTPQPIREIYYGGPEPDAHDPHAPATRKRTGGSSLDMVWVMLEELGKQHAYVGPNQGIPEVFQREFNANYIKIWRRRWEGTDAGKVAMQWMLKEYPPERYPEWAKLWTEPV